MKALNVFRLAGDACHAASFVMLLLRLLSKKNALGISAKTMELYLVVFVCRYLDLFQFRVDDFLHIYNFIMKILYIGVSGYIVYTIRLKEPFKTTYDVKQDSFLHWQFAVAPCAAVALLVYLFSGEMEILDGLWYFSEFLEALAIIPQLVVLQRFREVENLTGNYIFLLGAYRLLYIVNWVYRSMYETGYQHDWIVYTCGLVQTGLFVDFFYYYVQSKYKGGKFTLPE